MYSVDHHYMVGTTISPNIKEAQIGVHSGIIFENEITDKYILSFACEKYFLNENIDYNLKASIKYKIYKRLYFDCGMGLGHNKANIQTDHNFHTTHVGLDWRYKITPKYIISVNPNIMWYEYSAYIRPTYNRMFFNGTVNLLYVF